MLLIFLCLNFVIIVSAQKSIDALINTEKKFAKLSIDKNVKEAFLYYLDSNGVVFNSGNIINGIKAYQKQPAGKSKIVWEPSYSIISASGELGINTGPYKYFLNDTALKPLVQGQFTTVWHKTNLGEWKFLADMGISFTDDVELPVKTIHKKILPAFKNNSATLNDEEILSAEQSFIKDYSAHGSNAFASVISDDVWFNIDGNAPLVGKEAVLQKLSIIPSHILFTPVGHGISAAGDLVYVYGIVELNSKKENYLRIWQNNHQHWKLLLQVLLF